MLCYNIFFLSLSQVRLELMRGGEGQDLLLYYTIIIVTIILLYCYRYA